MFRESARFNRPPEARRLEKYADVQFELTDLLTIDNQYFNKQNVMLCLSKHLYRFVKHSMTFYLAYYFTRN